MDFHRRDSFAAGANIRPPVVAVDDDHLLAFCRRGGGYGTVRDGFMVRTESRDRGRTWSPGVDTEFPNPNAAIDLIKLANGHLAHLQRQLRRGADAVDDAHLTDGGKTWPTARELVNRPGDDAAYPYIIQTADGKIHGVYTSAGRSIVNHFSLEEADVAQPRNESSSAR